MIRTFPILFTVLFSLLCLSSTAVAEAPALSPEIRFLTHGTKSIVAANGDRPSVGMAMWLIEPNVLDATPQVQATAGIRLAHENTWVEFLGGGVFSPTLDDITHVFDVRASTMATPHLHIFGEVSAYSDVLYGFAQADIPIRHESDTLFMLGVEMEMAKAWKGSGGFIAAGPHVIMPWHEHVTTVLAYQIRETQPSSAYSVTDSVGRIYAIIDF
ncbi:hypothetical protein CO174_04470 [Candidatus Uhrbacteria bacterium CG_4_9_14_3_um_filter_50_9]|uniref:Outer membrane protein beta-barrel domain-containing protein n=1 Tax=Candidatus Uhrbacteria bacterium CG_4_9_14_3_um_filter_50_9 TaxID=1975035 RepID=A0A2M7XBE2_9BACT|nr:MAG: hypothetical protein CO174_04470 [Candidatus Uhrbacteria bacterium CG_4_9_14_3_um_filter_50_9]